MSGGCASCSLPRFSLCASIALTVLLPAALRFKVHCIYLWPFREDGRDPIMAQDFPSWKDTADWLGIKP